MAFICPECGAGGCNHMIQPGAAMPVALVCDLTAGANAKDYELLNILCNPDDDLPVISAIGFDTTTGIFELKYYNQDGTEYTGTTPVLCTKDFSYSTPAPFCHNGVDITRTDVFQNDSTTPLFSIWQDKLGAIAATPLITDIVSGWCTDTDYEKYILCDTGNNAHQFLRVVKFDKNIVPVSVADYELDGTTVYTLVGPVAICNSKFLADICIFNIADDEFIENALIDYSYTPPRLFEFGTNVQRLLQPTEKLGTCKPISICYDESDPELNGACLPGENVEVELVASLDANIIQDNTAETLCGGSWSHGPETPPAPFPIKEALTGNGFNNPNWILNGSAQLTGNGLIDAPGAGWLRLTSNVNSQFGTAILNTAFPSTQSVNFEFDYAAYGGSGADGLSIFYVDGAFPVVDSGGDGGAFGYSWNINGNSSGISHGIVGIALDEYGSFSTNSVGAGGNNAGANRVTVRGSGNRGAPNSNTYPFISSDASPAGKTLLNHPRNAPMKVRGSILNENGQLLLSVQIDYQDGDGFVPVVTRRNITAGIGGALPPTLKIGFGGATGGSTNFHEMKNLVVATAGKQYWRSFPITSDIPPACATNIKVCASVDVTITDDNQSVRGGDAEFEHWLRIVDVVNNVTLVEDKLASAPIKLDKTYPLEVCTDVLATNALANLRVYVGTETYDINGSYGSLWENFKVQVYAIGCPKQQYITTAISAPCPIDVRIVGGSVDGGGSTNSSTILTAPSIDTAVVCADGVPALRYERREPDGTIVTQFFGVDGAIVTPITWTPGSCGSIPQDNEYIILCDDNRSFLRRYVVNETGVTIFDTEFNGVTVYAPIGVVKNCNSVAEDSEYFVLCDNNGQFLRRYTRVAGVLTLVNTTLDGATAYVPVGSVVDCTDCCPQVVGEGCWSNGALSGKYTAIRNQNGSITLIDQITGNPVLVADVVQCSTSEQLSLTPSIQRLTGVGNIVVPVSARSVTITVLAGNPTVQIGATPIVTLPSSVSLSWSGDVLNQIFTCTGLAGTDFIVTTVR